MCDKQEQLDEVEFLQAMSKDEEFKWEESEETGLISGTLKVSPQLDHQISVKLVQTEKPFKDKQDGAMATPLQPHLQTKHSDSRPKESSAQLEHLPPFTLYFQLPHTYPSSLMPDYSLTCQWLNFTQLSALCKSLDSMWADNAGGVVLYNWQQLLATEALSTFTIESSQEFSLEFEDPQLSKPEWDPRAVQDINNPFMLISLLAEYDEKQKLLIFNESFFDCKICYMAKQGTKCARMSNCDHVYCRDCLTAYLKTKISDGDVSKLECPSCNTIVQPSLIKELVSPEDYNRFDKLLLQRTLEGMMDVTYCPRPSCGCATVQEDNSNMAQCPRCSFCFCVLCRHTWHGLAPCKLLPQDLKDLAELWDTLEESEKKKMAEQYGGRKKLETAFQEFESLKWVDKNAKRCPSCSAHIQKTDGCNKMTCTHCQTNFCWLCDSLLPKFDPYSHYRMAGAKGKSPCVGKLFEGLQGFDIDDI